MSEFDLNQKGRMVKLIKKTSIYLLLGLVYYFFVLFTGISIPCIIKLISGKYCPGCGLTRMFMELGKGNIAMAVKYNLLLLILLPIALVWGLYRAIIYVKWNKKEYSKAEKLAVIVVFVFTVAFWIMRNTEKFSWLAPIE